jgi:hypothetical protein
LFISKGGKIADIGRKLYESRTQTSPSTTKTWTKDNITYQQNILPPNTAGPVEPPKIVSYKGTPITPEDQQYLSTIPKEYQQQYLESLTYKSQLGKIAEKFEGSTSKIKQRLYDTLSRVGTKEEEKHRETTKSLIDFERMVSDINLNNFLKTEIINNPIDTKSSHIYVTFENKDGKITTSMVKTNNIENIQESIISKGGRIIKVTETNKSRVFFQLPSSSEYNDAINEALKESYVRTGYVPQYFINQIILPDILRETNVSKEDVARLSFDVYIGRRSQDNADKELNNLVLKNADIEWAKNNLVFKDKNGKDTSWDKLKKEEPALYLTKTSTGFDVIYDPVKWQKEEHDRAVRKGDWLFLAGEIINPILSPEAWKEAFSGNLPSAKLPEGDLTIGKVFGPRESIKPAVAESLYQYSKAVGQGDIPTVLSRAISTPIVTLPIGFGVGALVGGALGYVGAAGSQLVSTATTTGGKVLGTTMQYFPYAAGGAFLGPIVADTAIIATQSPKDLPYKLFITGVGFAGAGAGAKWASTKWSQQQTIDTKTIKKTIPDPYGFKKMTPTQAKSVFRELSLKLHPDKLGGSTQKFMTLKSSYEAYGQIHPSSFYKTSNMFYKGISATKTSLSSFVAKFGRTKGTTLVEWKPQTTYSSISRNLIRPIVSTGRQLSITPKTEVVTIHGINLIKPIGTIPRTGEIPRILALGKETLPPGQYPTIGKKPTILSSEELYKPSWFGRATKEEIRIANIQEKNNIKLRIAEQKRLGRIPTLSEQVKIPTEIKVDIIKTRALGQTSAISAISEKFKLPKIFEPTPRKMTFEPLKENQRIFKDYIKVNQMSDYYIKGYGAKLTTLKGYTEMYAKGYIDKTKVIESLNILKNEFRKIPPLSKIKGKPDFKELTKISKELTILEKEVKNILNTPTNKINLTKFKSTTNKIHNLGYEYRLRLQKYTAELRQQPGYSEFPSKITTFTPEEYAQQMAIWKSQIAFDRNIGRMSRFKTQTEEIEIIRDKWGKVKKVTSKGKPKVTTIEEKPEITKHFIEEIDPYGKKIRMTLNQYIKARNIKVMSPEEVLIKYFDTHDMYWQTNYNVDFSGIEAYQKMPKGVTKNIAYKRLIRDLRNQLYHEKTSGYETQGMIVGGEYPVKGTPIPNNVVIVSSKIPKTQLSATLRKIITKKGVTTFDEHLYGKGKGFVTHKAVVKGEVLHEAYPKSEELYDLYEKLKDLEDKINTEEWNVSKGKSPKLLNKLNRKHFSLLDKFEELSLNYEKFIHEEMHLIKKPFIGKKTPILKKPTTVRTLGESWIDFTGKPFPVKFKTYKITEITNPTILKQTFNPNKLNNMIIKYMKKHPGLNYKKAEIELLKKIGTSIKRKFELRIGKEKTQLTMEDLLLDTANMYRESFISELPTTPLDIQIKPPYSIERPYIYGLATSPKHYAQIQSLIKGKRSVDFRMFEKRPLSLGATSKIGRIVTAYEKELFPTIKTRQKEIDLINQTNIELMTDQILTKNEILQSKGQEGLSITPEVLKRGYYPIEKSLTQSFSENTVKDALYVKDIGVYIKTNINKIIQRKGNNFIRGTGALVKVVPEILQPGQTMTKTVGEWLTLFKEPLKGLLNKSSQQLISSGELEILGRIKLDKYSRTLIKDQLITLGYGDTLDVAKINVHNVGIPKQPDTILYNIGTTHNVDFNLEHMVALKILSQRDAKAIINLLDLKNKYPNLSHNKIAEMLLKEFIYRKMTPHTQLQRITTIDTLKAKQLFDTSLKQRQTISEMISEHRDIALGKIKPSSIKTKAPYKILTKEGLDVQGPSYYKAESRMIGDYPTKVISYAEMVEGRPYTTDGRVITPKGGSKGLGGTMKTDYYGEIHGSMIPGGKAHSLFKVKNDLVGKGDFTNLGTDTLKYINDFMVEFTKPPQLVISENVVKPLQVEIGKVKTYRMPTKETTTLPVGKKGLALYDFEKTPEGLHLKFEPKGKILPSVEREPEVAQAIDKIITSTETKRISKSLERVTGVSSQRFEQAYKNGLREIQNNRLIENQISRSISEQVGKQSTRQIGTTISKNISRVAVRFIEKQINNLLPKQIERQIQTQIGRQIQEIINKLISRQLEKQITKTIPKYTPTFIPTFIPEFVPPFVSTKETIPTERTTIPERPFAPKPAIIHFPPHETKKQKELSYKEWLLSRYKERTFILPTFIGALHQPYKPKPSPNPFMPPPSRIKVPKTLTFR